MSQLTRRRAIQTTAIASATLLSPVRARAQTKKTLKIGVMTDMSGPYAEATGLGDVLATRFAIEDFVKRHPDIGVELTSADMLLKPDVGASIARTWYDQEGVDAIFDIPQSAVALAVGSIAKEKDKLVIFTSAGVADLSGKYCSPNQIHWTFDLWANANGIVAGLMADGADTWYFILPDYISGHAMTNDAADAIRKLGGRELGRVTYAFPGTTDFASQLLKAKASGRAVVEQMKAMPVTDDFYQGQIHADGKFVHNMYVWQTKTLAESTGPWDFFKLLHTIPADQAFRPVGESGCPLVKA